ncbi:uncharacterized protein TrAtP1_006921 [Trichoderma atroviride]|nr:hypothetical protein TrAtP1_006921 [Trichoderma atroviride]
MDGWSEKGRPAVREALDHVWEVIDREVQHELAKRAMDNDKTKELLKATVSALSSLGAQQKVLQAENSKLRAQLAAMSSSLSPVKANSSTPAPSDDTKVDSMTPTPSRATTAPTLPSSAAIVSPP